MVLVAIQAEEEGMGLLNKGGGGGVRGGLGRGWGGVGGGGCGG